MAFTFTPHISLPEVIIIKSPRFEDSRGFFSESFKSNEFLENGIPPFVQENHSRSSEFVFRGLHYQLNPKAQGKLVYCLSGCIKDFAVDIRQGSPTYGEWVLVMLDSNSNKTKMVYVPPGFAHGFVSAGPADAHVIYKVTEYYSPEHDRSIYFNDPDIGINLEECFSGSIKDTRASLLKDAENNFHYLE